MNNKEILKKLNLSSFTAFDFETTGLDPYNDKIIEVAAIRFKDGEISDKFVSLINPELEISPLITDITGISNKMVRSAPTEEVIIDDFLDFLGDDPLVAHNIHFDERFLSQLCERLGREEGNNLKYDTLQLGRSLFFDLPVFNLSALSEYFGLSSDGAHRAENDTVNTGKIFINMIEELVSHPLEVISKVIALIKDSDIPNKQLYLDLGNTLAKSGDMKKGLIPSKYKHNYQGNTFIWKGSGNLNDLKAEDVFGKEGLLKSVHPNFEYRSQQVNYAEMADSILNDKIGVGVAEAGTGLGKSLAYLFGAFKKSIFFEDEGPTVIACNTKHLQDQLFYKDLPLLAKSINAPIKAVMLKGRNNYICKTRFNWLTSDSDTLDPTDIEALIPIIFWLEYTKTGDISECSGFFNNRRTWLKSVICSETGFCTGEVCNRYHGCFYGNIKSALYTAQILVVNHSLLMTEIESPGFLPQFNSVIVDETHNLTKSTYDQFKINWSEQGALFSLQSIDPTFSRSIRWKNIIDKIGAINPEMLTLKEELKGSVKDAQNLLKEFMINLTDDKQNRFNAEKSYQDKPIIGNIDNTYNFVQDDIIALKGGLNDIFKILEQMRKSILEIDQNRSDYPVLHSVFERGLEMIGELANNLVRLTEQQDDEWVYWFEGEYRNRNTSKEKLILSLHASLIDVSDILNEKLFNRFEHIFLTSATLKVNDKFDYFIDRFGLRDTQNIQTKEFSSPFLYDEQVTYYQYGAATEFSNDPKRISDLIYYLHNKFNRRIMTLFTSRKLLSDTVKYLRDKPGGRELPLFAQTRGASRPAIIKAMHQNSNGILFGTNSFWEGVDLPGDLLEILVLVKLPFDVPSEPLVKSYGEYINKTGGNSFMDFSLPECAIRFRQGFGRLIRTSYDSGMFICLDNRIVGKRYGEIIGNSIPSKMNVFSNIESIK